MKDGWLRRAGIVRAALVATAAAAAAVLLGAPAPAAAHPLGNFTVNRYARLEIGPERVRVRYVLDLAEIPTFQLMPVVDGNGDGSVTAAEGQRYADRRLGEIGRGLHLSLNGVAQGLVPSEAGLEMRPGQGGLQTMRITGWLEAPDGGAALRRAGSTPASVELRDENEATRVGWREMLVRAEGLAVSGAPTTDVTDELRVYPENMLMGPLDVRSVAFSVAPAGVPVAGEPGAAYSDSGVTTDLGRASERLTALVTSVTLTPAVILVALLTATLLGAMHALSPGHGKTIVAAYLVGSRGTARQALFLGTTVTIVHTAGVFALLLVTLFASRYVVPERFFPWMSLISGLMVVGVGLSLVRGRLRALRGAGHHHGQRHIELTHDHGFGAHSHAVPGTGGQAITWRSLLALGVSGGLLPCPSALVLGLGAIALNRALYGLVLIVFFSAGLAATLMAIGLIMVYSGRAAGRLRLLDRISGRSGAITAGRLLAATRIVPVASAGVVALAGLALSADAARQLDLTRLWETSASFRGGTANALSIAAATLAVYFALRRSRTADPVHGHGHTHGHGHSHAHTHSPI